MRRIIGLLFFILFFCAFAGNAEDNRLVLNHDGSDGIDVNGAFTMNDQICVNSRSRSAVKIITTGYADHKPSWSPDGEWIVFFRITGNESLPLTQWKTKICAVRWDGSETRELTSGEYADFNPTWSRDGKNSIIVNRYDPIRNQSFIYLTSISSKPGEEKLISDPAYSEFGHCSLKDGRIIVITTRGVTGSAGTDKTGFPVPYTMILAPKPGQIGSYTEIRSDEKIGYLPNRVSVSPDGTKVTFELDTSMGQFGYTGHPLVVADFDSKSNRITNQVIFYQTRQDEYALYPAWTKDSKGIVFFTASDRQRCQLFLYDVRTRKTGRISADPGSDYKYFCGEASPK